MCRTPLRPSSTLPSAAAHCRPTKQACANFPCRQVFYSSNDLRAVHADYNNARCQWCFCDICCCSSAAATRVCHKLKPFHTVCCAVPHALFCLLYGVMLGKEAITTYLIIHAHKYNCAARHTTAYCTHALVSTLWHDRDLRNRSLLFGPSHAPQHWPAYCGTCGERCIRYGLCCSQLRRDLSHGVASVSRIPPLGLCTALLRRTPTMADPYDPANPECPLQPEPEAAALYAIKRAEYLQGLEMFERRDYEQALSRFTALFTDLQGTCG